MTLGLDLVSRCERSGFFEDKQSQWLVGSEACNLRRGGR